MLSFNTLGRRGRLGNQMFQYAALMAIARKAETDFCIPPSEGKDEWKEHQLKRVFALPGLKFVGRQKDVPRIVERTFRYDPQLHLSCPKDGDLFGFFQSEKYFVDIADDVKREFTFAPQVDAYSAKVVSGAKRPVISLHVRRGDYLNNPADHPVCTLEYYAAALAHFPADHAVLVFSDDIAWCKSEKLFTGPRFFFAEGHPNHYDLCLMSHCSHHIIANSSFSWWGAWLGRNSRKRIVAPAQWFGGGQHTASHDTRDLIPAHWFKI